MGGWGQSSRFRLTGHVAYAVQEVSKTASKEAQNGTLCPGNERCAVEFFAKKKSKATDRPGFAPTRFVICAREMGYKQVDVWEPGLLSSLAGVPRALQNQYLLA